jgi:hypothetical protein
MPSAVAIRFAILPFTEAELLAAILSCHRDHVAFVDNEVAGGPSWIDEAAVAQEVVAAGPAPKPIAGVVVPAVGTVVPVMTGFDRLRRFINANRQRGRHGFIDLRSPGLTRLGFRLRLQRLKGAPVLGYIADGEYWIPGDRFEEVAGGAREALALKQDVDRRGLLETTRRGNGVSYVVKRPLPDGSRRFFVVIRHHAKKSPALGPALAAAATVSLGN